MNAVNNLSLENLSKLGEKYYLDELKNELEKSHMGEYAVIDVEEKKYKINADRFIAIKEAQEEFGTKLFYIVHVGMLQQPTMNYTSNSKKYAWDF